MLIISTVLDEQALRLVSDDLDQFMVHIFLCPKNNCSFRPIFNLNDLKQVVEYAHFNVDGMPLVKNNLMKGIFFMKVDLKDAYI